uniref:Uncharacterized protein n=1 Tax=Triticum urartu TaxID=4572 RepID=A0A8R7QR39_TRIUA
TLSHSHVLLLLLPLPDPLSHSKIAAAGSSHQLDSLIQCLEPALPHMQSPPQLDSSMRPHGDLRRRLVCLLISSYAFSVSS